MIRITAWIKSVYPFVVLVVLAFLIFLVFVYPNLHGTRLVGMQVETFRISDGWGYQIRVNKKVYIYQPFIPGQNKKPFPSKGIAKKAGQLVEKKLKQGVTPNLTVEELQKIGAIGAEE